MQTLIHIRYKPLLGLLPYLASNLFMDADIIWMIDGAEWIPAIE